MKSPRRPPVLARRLFELCAPPEMAESLLGDLLEDFDERASDDQASARRWFWGQLARSAGPLALQRLLRPLLTFATGAVAALGASLLVGSALEIALWSDAEPRLPLIALVAGVCALASSMSAAYAAHQVDMSCSRAVLVGLGLFVLAPDLLFTVSRSAAVPSASLWLPLTLAVATTLTGLHLGRRVVRNPALSSGDPP